VLGTDVAFAFTTVTDWIEASLTIRYEEEAVEVDGVEGPAAAALAGAERTREPKEAS